MSAFLIDYWFGKTACSVNTATKVISKAPAGLQHGALWQCKCGIIHFCNLILMDCLSILILVQYGGTDLMKELMDQPMEAMLAENELDNVKFQDQSLLADFELTEKGWCKLSWFENVFTVNFLRTHIQ